MQVFRAKKTSKRRRICPFFLQKKNLIRSSASERNAVKNIVLHFKNKLSCSLQVLYVVVGVAYQAILPPAEMT